MEHALLRNNAALNESGMWKVHKVGFISLVVFSCAVKSLPFSAVYSRWLERRYFQEVNRPRVPSIGRHWFLLATLGIVLYRTY